MFRLIISNEEAGLSTKVKIQLSKSLFTVGNIAQRGVKFSNVFTLPYTDANNRALGYPSRLKSNNRAFKSTAPYVLLGGGGIVSRGSVTVKSFDVKKGIKIQLTEGQSFWGRAGGLKLNDLDLWDHAFIYNSNNNHPPKSPENVFVFGRVSSAYNGASEIKRPCVYFRGVLEAIATSLGYSIDYGSSIGDSDINSLGCLSNATGFYVCSARAKFNGGFEGLLNFEGTVVYRGDFAEFNKTELVGKTVQCSYVFKGWAECPSVTEVTFNYNGRKQSLWLPSGRSFVNFKTDAVKKDTSITITLGGLVKLDEVSVFTLISEKDLIKSRVTEGETVDIGTASNIDRFLVPADYNMPVQTCKRFVSILAALNFLDFQVDEIKKVVKVVQLGGSLNRGNSIDLSGRVSLPVSYAPGRLFAKLNTMTYGNDTSLPPSLGSGDFFVDDDGAKGSAPFINVTEYSASEEVGPLLHAPIYDVGKVERASLKERIAYIPDGAYPAVSFSQISMKSIYSKYYSVWVLATQRGLATTLTVDLTFLQFKRLQHNPVFYVSGLSSYFIAVGITGFDGRKPCKIKAVRHG